MQGRHRGERAQIGKQRSPQQGNRQARFAQTFWAGQNTGCYDFGGNAEPALWGDSVVSRTDVRPPRLAPEPVSMA